MSSLPESMDWPDHQDRSIAIDSIIDTADALTAPADPLYTYVGPYEVAGYRSLAVIVNVTGTKAIKVRVWWDTPGASGSALTYQDKTAQAGRATRLLFQNQGVQINSIEFHGLGGSSTFDYTVMGSNLDPLVSNGAGWPTFYELLHPQSFLNGTVNPEYTTAAVFKNATFDNTWFRGVVVDNGAVNGSDGVLIVRLGPHGSYWHFQFVHGMGPNHGKLKVQVGQFTFGEDASPTHTPALIDSLGALESATTLGPGMTWVDLFTMDCYAVGAVKNMATLGTFGQMRIGGNEGDAVTGGGLDPDDGGIARLLNGGPGIWYLRFLTDGKNAASGGYNLQFASILLARESYWGFAAA